MSNELTVITSALPAIPEPAALKEILDENLDGVTFSFESVRVPSGGGLAFTITDEAGEPDSVKELVGVILDHYPTRAYWRDKLGEGDGHTPPTCASLDGKTGSLPRNDRGEYGTCHDCPFAQFGSGINQKGEPDNSQACKANTRVFILQADSIFPKMLVLPPTSTGKYDGSFSTYALKLTGRMKKLTSVITKVKLFQDKSRGGITYSKCGFYYVGDVPAEEQGKVEFLRGQLRSAMRSRPMDEVVEAAKTEGNGADVESKW